MPSYNFTERVRHVLANAAAAAQRWHHESVGAEHLVLALCGESDSTATAVLRHHRIEPAQLLAQVEEGLARPAHGTDAERPLPYTASAKKVLEYAMAETRDLGHHHVGTEHLLLGVLREGRGIGARILTAHGLTLEDARATTRRVARQPVFTAGSPDPVARRQVRAITVTVRYGDGLDAHEDFVSVAAAIRFLAAQ